MVQAKELRRLLGALVGVVGLCVAGTAWSETDRWTKGEGLAGPDIRDLASDGAGVLYAVTKGRIFKSTNKGNDWVPINEPFADSREWISKVFAAPDGVVYTRKMIDGKIFFSQNFGQNWVELNYEIPSGLMMVDLKGDLYSFSEKGLMWHKRGLGGSVKIAGLGETCPRDKDLTYLDSRGSILFYCYYASFIKKAGASVVDRTKMPLVSPIFFEDKNGVLFAVNEFGGFKSKNGGDDWEEVKDKKLTKAYKKIRASNKDYFYALDISEWGFFKSIDGGVTWVSARGDLPYPAKIYDFSIQDDDLYIRTSRGVFRSDDDGSHWIPADNGLGDHSIYDLNVAETGAVVSRTRNHIAVSRDVGLTWSFIDSIESNSDEAHIRLFELSDGAYYFLGYNSLRKSIDKGKTWTNMASPLDAIKDLGWQFPSAHTLKELKNGNWLVLVKYNSLKTQSAILLSQDQGRSWALVKENMPSAYDIFEGLNGNILTDGNYASRDFGKTWEKLPNQLPSRYWGQIVQSPSGKIYAWSDKAIYLANDGGRTWTAIATPPKIDNFSFAEGGDGSLYVGYTRLSDGVYRSLDNGKTWQSYNEGLTDSIAIRRLVSDKKGNLFAGTENGVFQIRPSKRTTTPFTAQAKASGPTTSPTLAAELTVDSDDAGQPGYLYIGAALGANLYMLSPTGWLPFDPLNPVAYSAVTLGTHSVPVLDGKLNLTPYKGMTLFAGYGRNAADLITHQKYKPIYTVQ